MAVVVAVDAGTTGVRAVAVDEAGRLVDRSIAELTQHFPRPGWVEHDPAEILRLVDRALADLAGRLTEPVAAIGITNQRETAVAWDRNTGSPLARAIVWQDRRTTDRCAELDPHRQFIRERTGLVTDPYFTATKFEWLLRHGGVTADDRLALGTVDSWVAWHLTGGASHVSDPSNASRTMLFDITTLGWSTDLCDLFGVPIGALGDVVPTSGVIGVTGAACPLGPGIAVASLCGDQQSALFGHLCTEPGAAKNTYGTGSFMLMNAGTRCPAPADGLLTTVAWQVPATALGRSATGNETSDSTVTHYALEGAIFITGAAVQWLRDGLGIIEQASDLEPLAASVPDSGGVLLVPAFSGLGSPWWDPTARGTIVGLTGGSQRAHLARAVIDAMATQTRDVAEAMEAATGAPTNLLRVDGGAATMRLLLQSVANHLGVPVVRPSESDVTALGAAYLAGIATGVWDSVDDLRDANPAEFTAVPDPDSTSEDEHYRQWLRAVERSRNWASS